MEEILHYVWKHKIFPLKELKTTDGRCVEVLNPGLHNTDAGPDFSDAMIKIDGILWAGNVEIHQKASDWYNHHHDENPVYSNVILHVVGKDDVEVLYPDGKPIPQLVLPIPQSVLTNYEQLLSVPENPRCGNVVRNLPLLLVHSWMSALYIERLEMRTKQIFERLEKCEKDWEHVLFITLARTFGFGKDGDAFEVWANTIPMSAVGKHRDDLFQIEAIFFGQAGLLDDEMISQVYLSDAQKDNYYQNLKKEYRYLSQKFSLTPINPHIWKFLRLRPQNFPHIRIAQLAMLFYEQHFSLSHILNAKDVEALYSILDTHVSSYWETHYTFASTQSEPISKQLTKATKDLIIINSIVPILFAYGKYKSREDLCERAVEILENLKPEQNRFITEWENAGVKCESAADSQALIHLTRQYCQPHECLRCRFGYEFIRQTPDFLKDNEK